MKVLFTGASSFTGYWFVRELADLGHQVVATFRRQPSDYEGVRKERVDRGVDRVRPAFECTFGDAPFMDLLKSEDHWDLFCHHAAEVTNYKSPDFDPVSALRNNTNNLREVLRVLRERGCRRLVLTGSVFEPGEGAGSDGLRGFSPYGVSKAVTAELVRYHTHHSGIKLGKFVIPTPFGPFEKEGFTSYLARTWMAGKTAEVRSPDYIRDSIHVSLLAKAYADFATKLPEAGSFEKLNPSFYQESNGGFTRRMATQLRKRLSLACEFELAEQMEFPEPKVRVNTDRVDPAKFGWSEEHAWDELADYYRDTYSGGG